MGRKQAAENGRKLAGLIDSPQDWRFVASPLGRTRETMNIVRLQLGLPAHGYETDDRLKEISFGLWETYTFEELNKEQASKVEEREADKFHFQPPLGESYVRLLARVRSWLPYVTENTVVVCHGGILRVLEHHFNGTPAEDVVHLTIPQDMIYKWDKGNAEWL